MQRPVPILLLLLVFSAACSKQAVRPDSPMVEVPRAAPVVAAAAPAAPAAGVAAVPTAAPSAEPAPVSAAAAPKGPPLVRFGLNSWYLDEPAREALKAYADELLAGGTRVVRIEGHADERGTSEYNLVLGQKRASEVQKYLARSGVPVSRLKALSFGEDRPVDRRSTEDAWAANRRAELTDRAEAVSR